VKLTAVTLAYSYFSACLISGGSSSVTPTVQLRLRFLSSGPEEVRTRTPGTVLGLSRDPVAYVAH